MSAFARATTARPLHLEIQAHEGDEVKAVSLEVQSSDTVDSVKIKLQELGGEPRSSGTPTMHAGHQLVVRCAKALILGSALLQGILPTGRRWCLEFGWRAAVPWLTMESTRIQNFICAW